MAVKAKEYDKVDIIKKVAELEGKNRAMMQENDKHLHQKSVDELNFDSLKSENK